MLTGQKFGRYELGAKIGEGGMGEIYAALDPELGRSIAIKLLPSEFTTDPDRRSRFRQEARVISALNHPNIITIFEVGENDHGSFLVTELVDGKTLRDVSRNDSLTLPKILRIIEQAANALVAAHAAQIVHRDIKPENIMVRRDGLVKLLDFGLAKPGETLIEDGENNKTLPGTVMGSARYMSPEQARGREVDERTDIWSLGVVLYELLTGRAPFDGETPADTLAHIIHKDPEPVNQLLPGIPSELSRILRKSLQKDREERYQSMKDMSLDLKDLLYDLDHANSGERSHLSSSPAFKENPTMMIHTTSGANHPTGSPALLTRISAPVHASRRNVPAWAIGAVSVVLITILGLGLYAFYSKGNPALAESAFDRSQMSRLTTDGKVLMPVISPDGKYVAYVAGELGNRSLVVRQVATDSSVTVIPATNLNYSAIAFSPTGDHIYYCETRSDFSVNTLYQIPALGGTRKKLIEDVDSTVTFSPDGKQFAFMRHVTQINEDHVFIADTTSLEMKLLSTSRKNNYDFFSNRLAWSPDGRRILIGAGNRQSGSAADMVIGEISTEDGEFRRMDAGRFLAVGNFVWFSDGSGFLFAARDTQTAPVQIWRASYPGLELHQVTNDFNDYGELSLSVDGQTVVTSKGDLISSLWKMQPGSKGAAQLTSDGRSPEGTIGIIQFPTGQLLYTRREGKEVKLWTSDANGTNAKLLGPEGGSAVSPAVTSDGGHIIYNHQKVGSSRIWRMDADGKNAVPLTEENTAYADYNPQITADGANIIFQRQMTTDERSLLMKMPVAGGPATTFYAEEKRGVWGPRLSRDGSRIAFTAYDMQTFERKVVVATMDDESFGQIEREFDYNLINQVAWAPDSKSLTFLSSRAGLPNLWSQPLDGSEARPLTDFKSGQIFNFAWSNDGKNLLLARGAINNELILIKDARSRTSDVAGSRPRLSAS